MVSQRKKEKVVCIYVYTSLKILGIRHCIDEVQKKEQTDNLILSFSLFQSANHSYLSASLIDLFRVAQRSK